MKISPNQKNLINFIFLFLFINSLTISKAISWDGYDYDNKAEIEIGQGNLVRENSIIQFYDYKDDLTYTAKVIYMESEAAGVKLIVEDLDNNKERTLIMK